MTTTSISKFEDFSAEIHLEIFKYLNGYTVCAAFKDLNSRFSLLLKNHCYSFTCINAAYCNCLCFEILSNITPTAIYSLKLFDVPLGCIEELFLTQYNIQQFTNLKYLIMLVNRGSKCLNDAINTLKKLLGKFFEFPNLSLFGLRTLFSIGDNKTIEDINTMVFNLSPLKLKNLTLKLEDSGEFTRINRSQLLFSNNNTHDNDHGRFSRRPSVMIEYLTILNLLDINDLKYIFLLMPKLKYLNLSLDDKNNVKMHRDPYCSQTEHIQPYNLNNLELLIPLNLQILDIAVDVSISYQNLIQFLFEPIKVAKVQLKKLTLQLYLYDSVDQQMVEQLIQTTLSTKLNMTVKRVCVVTNVPHDEYMGLEYYLWKNFYQESG